MMKKLEDEEWLIARIICSVPFVNELNSHLKKMVKEISVFFILHLKISYLSTATNKRYFDNDIKSKLYIKGT